MMNEKKEFRIYVERTFAVPEPQPPGPYPYPDGFWQRYITSGLNDRDTDYICEMLDDPDRVRADEFDRIHSQNLLEINRAKEWMKSEALKTAKT